MSNTSAQQAFWLVWNENGRVPMYRHDTLESAQTEAERLARANPGETFYVLEAVGLRVVDNMKRIDFRKDVADELPF
jgi:hypothetical protein